MDLQAIRNSIEPYLGTNAKFKLRLKSNCTGNLSIYGNAEYLMRSTKSFHWFFVNSTYELIINA